MIEHVWSVLCSNSIINSDTNNISLIEVIEQINIPPGSQYPMVVGNPFILATLWSRLNQDSPRKGRCTIRVVSPSGKQNVFPEQEINLEHHQRTRNRTVFQGFNVIEPGTYIFEVVLVNDGDKDVGAVVARLPLSVEPNPEVPENVRLDK